MAKYGSKAKKYVKKEMHKFKHGGGSKKHPIKSRKQAIAIGLSEARRHGGKAPKRAKSSHGRTHHKKAA